MKVAIITARGGSKRIPRKNIKPFLGKPMIVWSIEAVFKSGSFDKVLVSTDDEEIADISQQFGALVPFLRPADLAGDYIGVEAPLKQMLQWALGEYGNITAFSHVYPTAPTLDSALLAKSMKMVVNGPFKAAWGCARIPYPIFQVMIKKQSGSLERLFSQEKVLMRSQDMPVALVDVGHFYSFETKHYLEHGFALSDRVTGVEIPLELAIDIDTEEDWARAEAVLQMRESFAGCGQR